ncbi:MAG: Nramp family divalent metal transporter [Patescibacteria group bacterium]|jgi:NRAMP (natural resistance-associated macrophage protein)-like metal ion transporter
MQEDIKKIEVDIAEAAGKIAEDVSEIGKDAVKAVKSDVKVLGPGLITGGADDDSSGVVTYSQVGAQFGYRMNWLCLISLPLMTAVQEMCARIGIVTGKGLAGVIRNHYSKWVLYFAVTLLLIANGINIGADLGAMAAVTKLVFGGNFYILVIMFTIITLFLEIFVSYKVYSKYLKWLAFSLLSYFVTALIVHQDWTQIIKSIAVPSMPFTTPALMALVGFLGTTISPYLFFWQAAEEVEEEVKEKRIFAFGWGLPRFTWRHIKAMRKDNAFGMIFSNIVALFIMLTAAATLNRNGVQITDAASAAGALRPLAGDFAFSLFAIGIIGTGLLGVPVLAGSAAYAVSESFHWKTGLYRKFNQAHGFYGIITLATLAGLCINFIGIDPMKALYYAAIVNGIAAPFLILIILFIGNNKKIMGNKSNGPWSNFFGVIAFLLMSLAVAALFIFWGK